MQGAHVRSAGEDYTKEGEAFFPGKVHTGSEEDASGNASC